MPREENRAFYEALRDIVTENDIRSYLEIGVQEGDSLKEVLACGTILRVVLCDTWGREYGGTGHGNHVHILPMVRGIESVTFLDGESEFEIPHLEETFDLITVDGDHSLMGCLKDLQNCWEILRPGGFLVIDDLSHPAHLYLDYLFDAFVIEKDAIIIRHDTETGYGVGVLQKGEDK